MDFLNSKHYLSPTAKYPVIFLSILVLVLSVIVIIGSYLQLTQLIIMSFSNALMSLLFAIALLFFIYDQYKISLTILFPLLIISGILSFEFLFSTNVYTPSLLTQANELLPTDEYISLPLPSSILGNNCAFYIFCLSLSLICYCFNFLAEWFFWIGGFIGAIVLTICLITIYEYTTGINVPNIPFDITKMNILETATIALITCCILIIAYYYTKQKSKNVAFYFALIPSLIVICIYFALYSFVKLQTKTTRDEILEIQAVKFVEILAARIENTYKTNKFFRDRYETIGSVIHQDITNYILNLRGFEGVVVFDKEEKVVESYFNESLSEPTKTLYLDYPKIPVTINSEFQLEKIDDNTYIFFLNLPANLENKTVRTIRFYYNPFAFFDLHNAMKTKDELSKIKVTVNRILVYYNESPEKTVSEIIYPIELHGLNVLINIGVSASFISKFFGLLPQIMLATGIATALLLGFMVYLIQRYYLLTINLKVALKARTVFLTNVSHEIRTPLYGIMGTGSLMETTDLTPKQTKYLDIMMLSAHHLLDLVNNLLDSSKIESGSFPIIYEPCNIKELCQEQISILQYRTKEKKIALEFIYSEDTHAVVQAPAKPLKQIILNLVSNATKFTIQGKVTLKVDIISTSISSGILHIKVTDTGLGIPKDKQHLIFKKFSQIQNPLSSENRGTGLGLYLTKSMIEKIGGTITFESVENEGTAFSVVIPVTFSDQSANSES